MTKHDEVRQILHSAGFKFENNERTALSMTDEEVEIFLVEFSVRMTSLARELNAVFQTLAIAFNSAFQSLTELDSLLPKPDETETSEQ